MYKMCCTVQFNMEMITVFHSLRCWKYDCDVSVCRPASWQQRPPAMRSKNRSWWWCVLKNSVSVYSLVSLHKNKQLLVGVFTGLVCFSLCQQAGGRPIRGASKESRGLSTTTGRDQLTARSDCWPAGPLQSGEWSINMQIFLTRSFHTTVKKVSDFIEITVKTYIWCKMSFYNKSLLTFLHLFL